ncbi:iron-containing alcohol dehydrogenase [Maricaulis sp.]|uniref:iron-containing alcohol dehydrogenase n=1 Tax=Maricaulis sp. TaxID=1486257 RepID=UPI00260AEE0D|nr:iron-containing alcohol dehydrogenase [Maricaulis sp.]
MVARIDLTPDLRIGGGALADLPDVLARLGARRPLIISDQILAQLGYVEQASALLRKAGIEAGLFLDTVPEPTVDCVEDGLASFRDGAFDALIALGGGSAIDTAKAMAALAASGGAMRDLKVPHIIGRGAVPVIAIPTTAGTGSEVTRVTVITDAATDEKMLCMGPGLMPAAAIVDYELTISLPPRATADTGIDALTHAIEAYVSRKANAFSDQQALGAMRLIAPNLRAAYHEPDNRAAREAMMAGATMAGMAFSNASVALVHGMSRPIGAFFHVPHGLSNAMLLPAITRWSVPAARERYAECARTMAIADAGLDDASACTRLIDELEALNAELSVPTLCEFGVEDARFEAVIETMAEQAEASGSPGNNPRIPTQAEMVALYREVWV